MCKRLSLFLLLCSTIAMAQTGATGPTGPVSTAGASTGTMQSVAPASQGLTAPTLAGDAAPADADMSGRQNSKKGSSLEQQKTTDKSKSDSEDSDKNSAVAKKATRQNNQQVSRSDFEQFAADAAGSYLPVYGRNLFDGTTSTFAPMDHVPVPANYVIGPGDEIDIRVWGMVEFENSLIVDRNGQIMLPKVGVLNVSGLSYSQLDGFMRTAIGRLYKGFEMNITMGQLRSIQIFILGQVDQPGMYTVSSLSTLVDALFASGGPAGTGSMRNIELRRGNEVITRFDVYDLQQKGDRSHDVKLLPGDIIFIPPVGEQVALIGNVNQPGIYELKDKTSIADLVHGAGGFTQMASTDLAVLERLEDHRRRQVDQFPLDASNLQREIHGGDILRIFPISPKFENAVTLRGNVTAPGRFPWHAGMRVSDLIPTHDYLITREHWQQQNHQSESAPANTVDSIAANSVEVNWDYATIERLDMHDLKNHLIAFNLAKAIDAHDPAENQELQVGDVVTIFARQDVALPHAVTLRGNVASPGSYPWREGMRVSDLIPNHEFLITREHWQQQNHQAENGHADMMASIAANSTEINWDYAAIERLDMHDLSTRLIPFNLGKAIDTPDSADNQKLQIGDVVTIFSRKDLALPMDKHVFFIRIGGEVGAPGVYRVKPGDTLRDLIQQAGGLTSHSYVYGTFLTRLSAKQLQVEQLNLSIMRMKRDLISRYANSPQNTSQMDAQGKATVNYQLTVEQNLIDQLAAIQPTGRVILDLKTKAQSLNDLPAFPLEDGDSINIPARMSTVQIVGAVYNENAFRYEAHKTIAQYLMEAGGTTREADTSHIYLLRADGTTINNHTSNRTWRGSFEKITLSPGDAIVVPLHTKTPSNFWQNLAPVASVLSQTATTGLIMATYLP